MSNRSYRTTAARRIVDTGDLVQMLRLYDSMVTVQQQAGASMNRLRSIMQEFGLDMDEEAECGRDEEGEGRRDEQGRSVAGVLRDWMEGLHGYGALHVLWLVSIFVPMSMFGASFCYYMVRPDLTVVSREDPPIHWVLPFFMVVYLLTTILKMVLWAIDYFGLADLVSKGKLRAAGLGRHLLPRCVEE